MHTHSHGCVCTHKHTDTHTYKYTYSGQKAVVCVKNTVGGGRTVGQASFTNPAVFMSPRGSMVTSHLGCWSTGSPNHAYSCTAVCAVPQGACHLLPRARVGLHTNNKLGRPQELVRSNLSCLGGKRWSAAVCHSGHCMQSDHMQPVAAHPI